MTIQIQDLQKAGITDLFLDQFRNGLQIVFDGDDISKLKDFIQKCSISQSQKELLAAYAKQEYCRIKNVTSEEYEKSWAKGVVVSGAVGGVIGGVSGVGAGYGLSALGFTTSGIAKASIAAGIQSAIGSVQAGSAFAIAQSVGAQGLLFGPVVALGLAAAGATVGLGIYFGKKFINKRRKKIENQKKEEMKQPVSELQISLRQQITPRT